ncbi:MAG: PKD domain-containing protein [Treponema sp.]|nr:PKD domain-containing protein [Treponema sp.]
MNTAKFPKTAPCVLLALVLSACDLFNVSLVNYLLENTKKEEQFFAFSVAAAALDTFSIPTSGMLNNPAVKSYIWDIDWGDGQGAAHVTGTSADAGGISHTYANAGTYRITIRPAGVREAWLGAFGISPSESTGANSPANKTKIVSVDSPLTPPMTRTEAQINGTAAPPGNEWAYTFAGCDHLAMGEDFRFSPQWDHITSAGNGFAASMFASCTGLVMNGVFNLPQGMSAAGDNFAYSMFASCTALTMNGVFNLPQGMSAAGSYFAASMFINCNGGAFIVNDVFKFPPFDQTILDKAGVFYQTLVLGMGTPLQTRTAGSIINSTLSPSSGRSTFSPFAAWSDYSGIPANWRG